MGPLAERIEAEARASAAWPAYLHGEAFRDAVSAWARAEAVAALLWDHLSERDVAEALAEVASEVSEERREARGKSTRRSASRRTTAALTAWQRAESVAAGHRGRLGLDPASRAKIEQSAAATRYLGVSFLDKRLDEIASQRQRAALDAAGEGEHTGDAG